MAPNTNTLRFNLIPSVAIKSGLCLFLLIVVAFVPHAVSAAPLTGTAPLPDLTSFTLSVQNGDASALRGVYVDGLFALSVVQQPGYDASFVSTTDNTVTQFGMASQFGSVGLLAHNFLSGQQFFQLMPGMIVQLVYGDGHIERFEVTNVLQYQATSPYSVYSDFVDLNTHEYLTGTALFTKVYTGPRHVTFQTCIDQNGNSSWGRLFVTAEPVHNLSSVTQSD